MAKDSRIPRRGFSSIRWRFANLSITCRCQVRFQGRYHPSEEVEWFKHLLAASYWHCSLEMFGEHVDLNCISLSLSLASISCKKLYVYLSRFICWIVLVCIIFVSNDISGSAVWLQNCILHGMGPGFASATRSCRTWSSLWTLGAPPIWTVDFYAANLPPSPENHRTHNPWQRRILSSKEARILQSRTKAKAPRPARRFGEFSIQTMKRFAMRMLVIRYMYEQMI